MDWLLSYASSIFIYNASIDFKLERPESIKNDDGDIHFRWEIISEMIFSFLAGNHMCSVSIFQLWGQKH